MSIIEENMDENGDFYKIYKNSQDKSIEKIIIKKAKKPVTAKPWSAKHRVESLEIVLEITPMSESEEKIFNKQLMHLLFDH
jgi:hypothetical protein